MNRTPKSSPKLPILDIKMILICAIWQNSCKIVTLSFFVISKPYYAISADTIDEQIWIYRWHFSTNAHRTKTNSSCNGDCHRTTHNPTTKQVLGRNTESSWVVLTQTVPVTEQSKEMREITEMDLKTTHTHRAAKLRSDMCLTFRNFQVLVWKTAYNLVAEYQSFALTRSIHELFEKVFQRFRNWK